MLTHDKVVKLVGQGRLDDHLIVEIIKTGASEADLIEALGRLSLDDDVAAEKMASISPTVAALCDILESAAEDWGEIGEH